MDVQTPIEPPPAARTPVAPRPLSAAQTFWYSLASLGCGMFFSFNNAIIPLYLNHFGASAIVRGLMGSSHSIEGAIIQPIVGTLSDRSRSRLGRRRPFMLLFFPLSAVLVAATPLAAHLSEGVRLGMVLAAIFLFTVFFNIAFDPYQSLMPDITPEPQRGRVTAVWSLLGLLGQAGILIAPLPLEVKFYLVAAVMLVTTLLTCALTHEPPADALPAPHRSHAAEMREAIAGLRTLRQVARALVVSLLAGTGIGAALPFLTTAVQDITHCSDGDAQKMFLILMAVAALTMIPCGKATDVFGSKRMLLLALALIAAAGLAGMWVSTLGAISVVMAVAGLGTAAQSASLYPLLTELVPGEEVGFYTGLQSMTLSILQPLTIVAAGRLIDLGHVRAIFGLIVVTMVLSFLVLTTVQPGQALAEVERRNRAMGRAA